MRAPTDTVGAYFKAIHIDKMRRRMEGSALDTGYSGMFAIAAEACRGLQED